MALGRTKNPVNPRVVFSIGLGICVIVAVSLMVWSGQVPLKRLSLISPVQLAKFLCRWIERQSTQADGGISCNGTFWYRRSPPWSLMYLESTAFGFRLNDPRHSEGLLFFAQLLDGVFDVRRAAFVAVFVRLGRVRVVIKPDGGQATREIRLEPAVDDERWHWLSVYVGRDKLVVVLDGERGQILQANLAGNSYGLRVNSGLYFAGVVDSTTLLASHLPRTSAEGDDGESGRQLPGPFHGTLSDFVIVNGELFSLSKDSSFQRGFTEEQTGPYLLDVVKYDLSKPLSEGQKAVIAKTSFTPLDVKSPTINRVPVVTAISEDHADEVQDLVSSIHYHMPGTGVIIYDLGLSQNTAMSLAKLCNVVLRSFRRDLYGGQMWNLRWYMWKPLLVHSIVQEFGGAIYADSSVRFNSSVFQMEELKNGSWGIHALSPKNSGSISGFTHDDTLNYFGVQREEVAKAEVAVGTMQVWFDRPLIREVILRQWVRCALDLKCMAPPGSKGWPCDFPNQYSGNFIGCHRYDQSALSLSLFKVFRSRDGEGYLLRPPRDLKLACIIRKSTSIYPRCHPVEGQDCACQNKTASEIQTELKEKHPYCFYSP